MLIINNSKKLHVEHFSNRVTTFKIKCLVLFFVKMLIYYITKMKVNMCYYRYFVFCEHTNGSAGIMVNPRFSEF